MRRAVERALDRWVQAQISDWTTRDRILEFEVGKESAKRIRWSVVLICCFGGLMLAAGALLSSAITGWASTQSYRVEDSFLSSSYPV